MHDLFDLHAREAEKVALGADAVVLPGFACEVEAELVADLRAVTALAPFRNMVTPGGYTMSVAMTNCGTAGWITDFARLPLRPPRSRQRPSVATDARNVPQPRYKGRRGRRL
jgi:alkylated DNA repair dioxygenase AlkB